MRIIFFIQCFFLLTGCVEAVITTYNAKVPKELYQKKTCENKQDVTNFQYTALYDSKTIKTQENIVKKDARDRIKYYYQLADNFNLENCLLDEEIHTQEKYNLNTAKDSTDLLYEQKKINNEQVDIEIKTYQK